MTYSVTVTDQFGMGPISCSVEGHHIPHSLANRHYQEVLDAIIAEGADCFDGDIPEELQAAADAKLASGAYNANRA